MGTLSELSMYTCTNYNLDRSNPELICLMNHILCFIFKFKSSLGSMLWYLLIWSSLGSYVELLPLIFACGSLGYPGICFLLTLTRHHCSHCVNIHLAKNMKLVYMYSLCIPQLLHRYLLWLIQGIFHSYVHQWSWHGRKSGVCPIYIIMEHHSGW